MLMDLFTTARDTKFGAERAYSRTSARRRGEEEGHENWSAGITLVNSGLRAARSKDGWGKLMPWQTGKPAGKVLELKTTDRQPPPVKKH